MTEQARAWSKLIQHACDETAHIEGSEPKEFNVDLQLDVGYRGITFVCKEGTATYDVNTIGGVHSAVLFDWENYE